MSRPARKSMSEVPNVSKNNMLSHSASLPRPARAARLPSLVESQQLQLELRELEKSPRIDSKRDMEPSPRTINQPPELSPRTIPTDQEQFSKSDPERPPLPPKPSPPSFSNFIIAPQPFRRAEGEHEAPSLAQQAIQSWYFNNFLVLLFRLISLLPPYPLLVFTHSRGIRFTIHNSSQEKDIRAQNIQIQFLNGRCLSR